jgi:hypothetical protein
MADKKISALTSATTPLAGTEVLPIVQGGATVKVPVSDLTAGRAISATQLTLTSGNVIVPNGNGIDFSATPGAGTSELLDDYEEGTWTPNVRGTATYTNQIGSYTKVGNLVTISGRLTILLINTGDAYLIDGLPFAAANNGIQSSITINAWSSLTTTPVYAVGYANPNQNLILLNAITAGSFSLGLLSILGNGSDIHFSGTYTAA